MEINHKRYWFTDIHDVKDNSEHLYHTVSDLVNEHSLGKIYLIGTEITKFAHLFNSKTFLSIIFRN
jgi:alanine racemase